MVTRCRSRAGLSPSSPSPAQPGHSARFAGVMAEACSRATLVSQASWKQLEADLTQAVNYLENEVPTWSLASLQTDLRHMGIEPPVQITLWPNRPPPLLAAGRAPGSTIKGVFSKATDSLEKT